jgi:hypothetical protein
MEYAGKFHMKYRRRRFTTFHQWRKETKRSDRGERDLVCYSKYSNCFGKFAFARDYASRSKVGKRIQVEVRIQAWRLKCIKSGKWTTCLHPNWNPVLCQSVSLERRTLWCKKRYLVTWLYYLWNGSPSSSFRRQKYGITFQKYTNQIHTFYLHTLFSVTTVIDSNLSEKKTFSEIHSQRALNLSQFSKIFQKSSTRKKWLPINF